LSRRNRNHFLLYFLIWGLLTESARSHAAQNEISDLFETMTSRFSRLFAHESIEHRELKQIKSFVDVSECSTHQPLNPVWLSGIDKEWTRIRPKYPDAEVPVTCLNIISAKFDKLCNTESTVSFEFNLFNDATTCAQVSQRYIFPYYWSIPATENTISFINLSSKKDIYSQFFNQKNPACERLHQLISESKKEELTKFILGRLKPIIHYWYAERQVISQSTKNNKIQRLDFEPYVLASMKATVATKINFSQRNIASTPDQNNWPETKPIKEETDRLLGENTCAIEAF
jgi:hypothetical protein